MSKCTRVLVCNRGEIAIRIAKAASLLGIESVGIHAAEDERSLHNAVCTRSVRLPAAASGDPVAAYLDAPSIVEIAKANQCDCVHPGYGFLSENAEFAELCAANDIKFIGPAPDALRLFGDKVAARTLAVELGIPVVPGSSAPVADVAQARDLIAAELRYPVMLKAAAGGGGRGMRAVNSAAELPEALERCASEAGAAFGDSAVFIEQLVVNPKHIEVQVLADQHGHQLHLYERDCSVQQRNQKVLEIAPAPDLAGELRANMFADALKLVAASGYESAGTVEFLVEPETGRYYFIECNPRVQVEHTITEQITGFDIVEAQFRIAGGVSLAELGLPDQASVPVPNGFAIQARVVAQGPGTLSAYKEPTGPGVRVDGCGYAGYTPPGQFDPLLAKVIGRSNSTGSYASALSRTLGALNEFHLSGLPTNLPQLRLLLDNEQVVAGDARTTLIEGLSGAADTASPSSAGTPVQFLEEHAGSVASRGTPIDLQATPMPELREDVGQEAIRTPMAGAVVEVPVKVGERVAAGDTLLVLSAMKMETVVSAPCAGVIEELQPLSVNDSVASRQIFALLTPTNATGDTANEYGAQSWAPTLKEVETLRSLAAARFAADTEDPGVIRQRNRGKLTCRERIDLLLDDNSFREVGSIAGFASYDEDGSIAAFTPANSVGGWGNIKGRTTIVCADDFTSRGGHADGAIGAKSGYLDRLAIEMCIPSVRLLDGSSGGGSVAAMVPEQKKSGESNAKESSGAIKAGRPRVAGGGGSFLPGHLGSTMYAEQLSTVPVVNLLLGSVVGIGAAKAVLGHFSVMVRDVAQLFVAGPPVVSHAMGYEVTKEELGGWHIHCKNGSVDNLAEDESQAMEMARRFLSYLPPSVYEAPPVVACSDPIERREEQLFTIVPRKRTTTFDVRRAIELMADEGSFFEIGPLWATDQITGFVRFNGHPLGVIASDSQHTNGGALTADGCNKLKRHLDLCDLFHIPVLNLVDNPGFAVGIEHEINSTIRRGGEWMVAFAQVSVPIFTVVMRRSFGVAGNNYATPRSRPSTRVIWPAADTGGIPPEGGIEAAYKRQLAEAEDPVALKAELMARIESARGPVGPLNRFQMEEMIDPRDTRRYICEWVERAYKIVAQPARLVPRALQFRP